MKWYSIYFFKYLWAQTRKKNNKRGHVVLSTPFVPFVYWKTLATMLKIHPFLNFWKKGVIRPHTHFRKCGISPLVDPLPWFLLCLLKIEPFQNFCEKGAVSPTPTFENGEYVPLSILSSWLLLCLITFCKIIMFKPINYYIWITSLVATTAPDSKWKQIYSENILYIHLLLHSFYYF